MRALSVLVLALSAFGLAQPVLAADTAELTRQVQTLQQLANSLDVRLGKLEGAIQQNQQLLGLLKEVETLKAEVAKMRGQAEVQVHQLDTLGKRQNDLYVDLDQRIADLAKAAKPAPGVAEAAPAAPGPQPGSTPAPPSPAATAAPAPPQPAAAATPAPQLDPLVESRTYEAALNHFREANYAGAIAGFKGFLKAYPDSALAPNAQYWVGYSYYTLKDYKSALAHQQKLVAAYPTSAKVPDALLNIASAQSELGDAAGARRTHEEIVAKHPQSEAAAKAKQRLSGR